MVTTATIVGSFALKKKKLKIDHLWSSESIKDRLWSPFCSHRVQIYRRIVRKAKNNVGNHSSHDATLTADLHVAHVVRRDAFGNLILRPAWRNHCSQQSLEISIFSCHFVRHSFQRIWKKYCLWRILQVLKGKPCVTSVAIILFEKNFPQTSPSFKQIFLQKTRKH